VYQIRGGDALSEEFDIPTRGENPTIKGYENLFRGECSNSRGYQDPITDKHSVSEGCKHRP
jgi:hypothetical protein